MNGGAAVSSSILLADCGEAEPSFGRVVELGLDFTPPTLGRLFAAVDWKTLTFGRWRPPLEGRMRMVGEWGRGNGEKVGEFSTLKRVQIGAREGESGDNFTLHTLECLLVSVRLPVCVCVVASECGVAAEL